MVNQVNVGFAEPRRRYTQALERYVLELLSSMTILDVAELLGMSWLARARLKDVDSSGSETRAKRRS